MSRLSIEISTEQHKKIKALAALQGKSIKDLILDNLLSPNAIEERKALEELEVLLLARIENAHTAVSKKTIQQITDDVLKSANP